MHDSPKIPRSEAYETAWELIPWYVNGSLPKDEAEMVRHQAQLSPQFAAEVARQHELARQVATFDPSEAPVDRSWEKLRAQIDSESRARTPRPEPKGLFAGLRGGYALGGLGLAACLLLAVMLYAPQGETYQTLTSGAEARAGTGASAGPNTGASAVASTRPETGAVTAAVAGAPVKFQLAGDLAEPDLAQLLATHGLVLIGGPSETGVYTAVAAPGTDPARAAQELMGASEVLFAAPGE